MTNLVKIFKLDNHHACLHHYFAFISENDASQDHVVNAPLVKLVI